MARKKKKKELPKVDPNKVKKAEGTQKKSVTNLRGLRDKMKSEAEEKQKKEEEAREDHRKRVAELKCPSCESKQKYEQHIPLSYPDGSYMSIGRFFICQACGTMFKDLGK